MKKEGSQCKDYVERHSSCVGIFYLQNFGLERRGKDDKLCIWKCS